MGVKGGRQFVGYILGRFGDTQGLTPPTPTPRPPISSRYRQRLKVTGPARPPTLLRGPGDTGGSGGPGRGAARRLPGAAGAELSGSGPGRYRYRRAAARGPTARSRRAASRAAGRGGPHGGGRHREWHRNRHWHRAPPSRPQERSKRLRNRQRTRGGNGDGQREAGPGGPVPSARALGVPSIRPCSEPPRSHPRAARLPPSSHPRYPQRSHLCSPVPRDSESICLSVPLSARPSILPPLVSRIPVCLPIHPSSIANAQSPSVHSSVLQFVHPPISGAQSESICLSILSLSPPFICPVIPGVRSESIYPSVPPSCPE